MSSASYAVAHIVERRARAPVERLFDEVTAEDVLPKVLHRYLLVPAVVGTEGLTGPWNTPGSQRQVRTSDGRTLREEVTAWERPCHFAYRVEGFTGVLGAMVSHAVGEWTVSGDDGGSAFAWTYTFFARSRAVAPVVRGFVRLLWSGYMAGCAERCVALAEPRDNAGVRPRLVRRVLPFQNRVVNPLVVALLERGWAPPTYALVETIGRRSGRPRRVPVANGLDGDTFWLIAGLGERAAFVHNVRANPRVRVKARPARLRHGVRMRWRSGTACPLPDDDAGARHQWLGRGRPAYRLDGILLRALSSGDMLTVRVDLDPKERADRDG